MSGLKTLEEHILSIETMARLCFFYASRWLKGEFAPEKSMSECVSKHTPLLFHGLIHYDMEKWQEIPLCRLIMETADKLAPLPPDLFEEEMWALCGKEINARAEETYPDSRGVGTPPSWNCGTLKYDPPRAETPRTCAFHIYNTVSPHSIFEDPEYLILCFKLLMKETELRYGADTLTTTTWLNDRPRWLAFFPEEWQQNLSPRDEKRIPGVTVGDWGPIINARGCINPKWEALIRETGHLPYCVRTGFCSYTAMRRHLDELLKGL